MNWNQKGSEQELVNDDEAKDHTQVWDFGVSEVSRNWVAIPSMMAVFLFSWTIIYWDLLVVFWWKEPRKRVEEKEEEEERKNLQWMRCNKCGDHQLSILFCSASAIVWIEPTLSNRAAVGSVVKHGRFNSHWREIFAARVIYEIAVDLSSKVLCWLQPFSMASGFSFSLFWLHFFASHLKVTIDGSSHEKGNARY